MNKLLEPYVDSVVEEDDVVRELCKASFYSFVQEFWDEIIPEDPVWNWHIEFICDELQKLAERVFRNERKEYDQIINIPPGTTKSTIVSVMFTAWTWTRMPTSRHINGSHSAELALDFSNKARRIIRSDKYQRLFPEIKLRSDQDTKTHWENTLGGSRYSTSVGKKITGKHAHFILIDDPIDPKGTKSEADLKTANDWMNETLPSRKVDRRITPTVLIMQRLHQDDPTGAWLTKASNSKKRRIRHIVLPATTEYEVKPGYLKKRYIDGQLDPVRLDSIVLEEAAEDGIYTYAGQYGQSPIPAGGGMFKTGIITMVREPPARVLRVARYWDKAATEDAGARTAGVKMGIDSKDRIIILHVVKGQWATDVREKVIHNTAIADGYEVPIGVELEGGSGGKDSMFLTKKKLRGYNVRSDKPTGDKVARADAFSVELNEGNVFMVIGDWNAEYIEELKYFPNSKYKDQIDASSGCYKMLRQIKIAGAL